ncbi:DUF5615 family PIN-like protein [Methylomarinovum caldicuralii]|uniref:DUF5615 family PIN-like protein n=1 Tax=Methylomarinovum caldicuralii TaxID=438856 RepID=UPI0029557197|nr:DUF5615 family PIN-like protein [Methylomarinovum caldicuralii]
MKLLLDMNLPPGFAIQLQARGWDVVHWIEVGRPEADDRTIMRYAACHGYVVVSHDLDFGALLAATQAEAPSVIQLRVQNVLSSVFLETLDEALRRFAPQLEHGALIVVEPSRSRARVLPLLG